MNDLCKDTSYQGNNKFISESAKELFSNNNKYKKSCSLETLLKT